MIVLLVEDHDLVRELVCGFLEGAGHSVIQADSAEAALEAVRDGERPVDLLVTDIDLPGLDGGQLGARLRQHSPLLKIVYVSGNFDDSTMVDAGDPTRAFLHKPFSREVFLRTVRELFA
jgi:two-component system, cell cycle sensor histidine kinase and response regulator CckA